MSRPSAEALEAALAAAKAAFARGDGAGGVEAVATAAAACAHLRAAGVRLDPDTRARIAAIHAEVLATATDVRDALAGEVRDAGRSRRAARAYGAR